MLYIPEIPASKLIFVELNATPSFLKLFGIYLYSDSAIDNAEVADSGRIFFNLDVKLAYYSVCYNRLDVW